MKKVERTEIVDYQTWAQEVRPSIESDVLAAKSLRRVRVEPYLTFLFENALTIRWQIQEMMRVERIVKESAIQHEIDTYNGLLGGPGELGVVLLIEIEDKARRDVKLAEWRDLLDHVYVELEDGRKVGPRFDPMQIGEERLTSVQYLTFPTEGQAPVAVGSTREGVAGRAELTVEQRAALAGDLAGS